MTRLASDSANGQSPHATLTLWTYQVVERDVSYNLRVLQGKRQSINVATCKRRKASNHSRRELENGVETPKHVFFTREKGKKRKTSFRPRLALLLGWILGCRLTTERQNCWSSEVLDRISRTTPWSQVRSWGVGRGPEPCPQFQATAQSCWADPDSDLCYQQQSLHNERSIQAQHPRCLQGLGHPNNHSSSAR